MSLDRSLFIDNPAQLLSRHGDRLRSLRGQSIDATWVAWDTEDDEWFAEEPVVLEIGGSQLEIVCWKLDEIALTWGAVDLSSRPSFVADWSHDFQLEWRRDAIDLLRCARGNQIVDIHIVEYLHRMTVVESPSEPETVGSTSESWLLHGVELSHASGSLLVFNALDENGLSSEPSNGPDFRRTTV